MRNPRRLVFLGALAAVAALGARTELAKVFNLMYERRPLDATGAIDMSQPPMRFYYKGQRARIDNYGMEGGQPSLQTSSIMDCDSARMITVNWDSRTYMLMTFDEFQQMQKQALDMAGRMAGMPGMPGGEEREGGTVVESMAWSDSAAGRMFDLPVRYVGQVSSREASADACSPGQSRQEIHRWVTELEVPICIPPFIADGGPAMAAYSAGGCRDSVVTRTSGRPRPFSFILREEIMGEDGRTIESGFEVVELSRDSLPDSLFVPPAGFERMDLGAALAGAASAGAAAAPAVRPKAAGTIRIGVAVGLSPESPAPAPVVADHIVERIIGQSGFDAVRLVASDKTAALAEAPGVEADYVLVYDVEAKAGVSGKGMLGGALGGAIGQKAAGGAMKLEAEGGWELVRVDGSPVADGDVEADEGTDDPMGKLSDILGEAADVAVAAISR